MSLHTRRGGSRRGAGPLLAASVLVALGVGPAARSARAEEPPTAALSAGAPDLTVALTSDAGGPLSPGDTVGYSITVTNVGTGVADDVALVDTLPAGVALAEAPGPCEEDGGVVACALATLGAGDEASTQLRVAIRGATCGPLENEVSVSSPDEPATAVDDANHADVTDHLFCAPEEPDLVVNTTSDARRPLPRGHGIVYTVTVTNVGLAMAIGVHLHDDVPSGLRIMGALPTMQGGACSAIATADSDGNEYYAVDCVRGSLEAGHSASATIRMRVDASVRCGRLVNTATVVGANEAKARRGNNRDTATDRIACVPSVTLGARAPSAAHVGDRVTYTTRVSNDGERPLVHVTLRDTGCGTDPRRIGAGNGDGILGRGETWVYSCTHTVTAVDGDPARGTASATAIDRDGRVVRAVGRHETDVLHPRIEILQTASASSGRPRSTVAFSYVVTNTGDAPLFDVRVDDVAVGHVGDIPALPAGSRRTLSGSAMLPARSALTGAGIATARDALGGSVLARASATVTVEAAHAGAGHQGGSAFTGARVVLPARAAAALLAVGLLAWVVTSRRPRGSTGK